MCADRETVVLVCDECAHVWTRPDEVDEGHAFDPLRPDFARHCPGLSLLGSRWATVEEVLGYGWGAWIGALNAIPREERDRESGIGGQGSGT